MLMLMPVTVGRFVTYIWLVDNWLLVTGVCYNVRF